MTATATHSRHSRYRSESDLCDELCDTSPLGFDAGDSNLFRYVGNSPTNLTDSSGLAPIEFPGGMTSGGNMPVFPPPKPTVPTAPVLTPDQQKLIEMAGGDTALEAELMRLFDLLERHPTYRYGLWPFAKRDRCHLWANETHTDILDEKFKGHFKGIGVTKWSPKYLGFIPTFWDHGVLIMTLLNGKTFYLDNYLYGGSDHIFFDIPRELVDESSPEYQDFLKLKQEAGRCYFP